MSHKATRRRKRAERELLANEGAAEKYSRDVNWEWNRLLCQAFGLDYTEDLGDFDLRWAWDKYLRQVNQSFNP